MSYGQPANSSRDKGGWRTPCGCYTRVHEDISGNFLSNICYLAIIAINGSSITSHCCFSRYPFFHHTIALFFAIDLQSQVIACFSRYPFFYHIIALFFAIDLQSQVIACFSRYPFFYHHHCAILCYKKSGMSVHQVSLHQVSFHSHCPQL